MVRFAVDTGWLPGLLELKTVDLFQGDQIPLAELAPGVLSLLDRKTRNSVSEPANSSLTNSRTGRKWPLSTGDTVQLCIGRSENLRNSLIMPE